MDNNALIYLMGQQMAAQPAAFNSFAEGAALPAKVGMVQAQGNLMQSQADMATRKQNALDTYMKTQNPQDLAAYDPGLATGVQHQRLKDVLDYYGETMHQVKNSPELWEPWKNTILSMPGGQMFSQFLPQQHPGPGWFISKTEAEKMFGITPWQQEQMKMHKEDKAAAQANADRTYQLNVDRVSLMRDRAAQEGKPTDLTNMVRALRTEDPNISEADAYRAAMGIRKDKPLHQLSVDDIAMKLAPQVYQSMSMQKALGKGYKDMNEGQLLAESTKVAMKQAAELKKQFESLAPPKPGAKPGAAVAPTETDYLKFKTAMADPAKAAIAKARSLKYKDGFYDRYVTETAK